MSWEEGKVSGTIGPYHGNKTGSTEDTARALVAYFIDLFEQYIPNAEDRFGGVPITYTWINAEREQEKLDIPSVGITATYREHWNQLNSAINANGNIVPGEIVRGSFTLYILGQSTDQRDWIERRIDRILKREINFRGEGPIIFIKRMEDADDRGFGMTERFVLNTVWQTMAESDYLKIMTFRIGFVEEYLEEDDYLFGNQVIGQIYTDFDGDGVSQSRFGSVNLRIDFTPTE